MCVELQETAFLPRKLESWIVKTACTNFTRQTDTILLTCVGTHVRYVGFWGSHTFVRCVLRSWSPGLGKGKGKLYPIRAHVVPGGWGVKVWLYSFFNLDARWGGWSHHAPAALSPGKTRYPLNRRLGGPQGRSVQVRKISRPPGFFKTFIGFLLNIIHCPLTMSFRYVSFAWGTWCLLESVSVTGWPCCPSF